jgi:hypothetical protein
VSLGDHAISGTQLTALQNWHPILSCTLLALASTTQDARHFVDAIAARDRRT